MSGRSAYVRKEKTKVKDGQEGGSENGGSSIIGDFPIPHGFDHDIPFRPNEHFTVRTSGSERDDLAYARVRKPHVPVIDVSGIEKSSFRSLVDKKSEGVRKALMFGRKKKDRDQEPRPPTSTATERQTTSYELDSGEYVPPPTKPRNQQPPTPESEFARPAPPQGKLPPIPQGPQLKRWVGSGRAPQPWNKIRKDPELWDPNGDTLIFFGHETHQTSRPPPSFRLSSHAIEATGSRFLLTLLHEGALDEQYGFDMPPSPISSPGGRASRLGGRAGHPTPPVSDGGRSGFDAFDGQISYEVYFPVPLGQSKSDILRHQVTTRNVFALLFNASLVGHNMHQALTDLHERLEVYMPPEIDAAGMIIEWLVSKGLDDVRERPEAAAALLSWSESQGVRWEEGWKEAFVHSAGMYNRLESTADFKYITPYTRALLERGSLEMQVRVHNGEDRLGDFDFGDMWPAMSSHPPPSRTAFERCRKFFLQHYRETFQHWPPAAPERQDHWLTRTLAQKMQKDFAALYDHLVNREAVWDGSEERSGRKWNIVCSGNRSFDADSPDLPFTDLLVAFDNLHKYPHIPHPYPHVPSTLPVRTSSKDNLFKTAKKSNKPADDKMAERKAALAYTEATNIYLLGSDFADNELVDAFLKFEKADRPGDVDPHGARRGRWVLIYGVLQTLASISVDTPNLRYTDNVTYHLSSRLHKAPPWNPNQNIEEASHVGSHCWTIRESWQPEAPVRLDRRPPVLTLNSRSTAPSVASSDAGSSLRSPTLTNASFKSSIRRSNRVPYHDTTSYSGYAPGIEKLDEWPVREESKGDRNGSGEENGNRTSNNKKYVIKDFDLEDDYNF
jgi:hypothetical protein